MSEKERLSLLEEKLLDPNSGCNIDTILDVVSSVVADCNHPAVRKNKLIGSFLDRCETVSDTIQKHRLNYNDFNLVKIIGQGAFGTVQLVRHKTSKKVFAMKVMNKNMMLDQANSAFFWEEREIMAKTVSDWIVKLYYAFMDTSSLYICMEYMPGGDLVNWLTANDMVPEEQAAFYIAEIVLAIESLHSMGFIHRDIKPENMLLDVAGHIKLADFGTCIRVGKDGYVFSSSAIGTPDYLSPEVLLCQEKPGKIGPQVDWWAVGVVLYEMLFGETAFYGESLVQTYGRIMSYKTSLTFPSDEEYTKEAEDIIRGFLSDPDSRLGKNGAAEIKRHPFFQRENWTWENIRRCVPPFVPELSSDIDTSNFEEIELDNHVTKKESPKFFTGEQLAFAGFTFNRENHVFKHSSAKSWSIVPGSSGDPSVIETLKGECENLNSQINLLNARVSEAEKKKALCDLEVRDLDKKVMSLESEKKKINDSLKQMKQSLSHEKVHKEQLSSDFERQIEELKKLKKNCTQLDDQLEDEKRNVATMRNRIVEKDEAIAALQTEADTNTAKIRENIQAKNELEQELLQLMEQLDEERDINKDLRDKRINLEKKNKELEAKLQELNEKSDRDLQEMKKLTEVKNALEEKIEELNRNISNFKLKRSESVSNEESGLNSELKSQYEEKISSLEKECQLSNAQKRELDSKLSTKENELSQKMRDIDALKQSQHDMANELESKKSKIDEHVAVIQANKQEINKLKLELGESQNNQATLNNQISTTKSLLKKKDEEIDNLKERLESSQLFTTSYKTQVEDLEDTIKSIRDKEEDSQKKLKHLKSEYDITLGNLRSANGLVEDERAARVHAEQELSKSERDKTVLQHDKKVVEDNLKSQLANFDSKIQALTDKESQLEKLVDNLRVESDKDKEILQKEINEVDQLTNQNIKLQREVDVQKKLVTSTVAKLDQVLRVDGKYKAVTKDANKKQKFNKDGQFLQMEKELKNKSDEFQKKEKIYQERIAQLKKDLSEQIANFIEEKNSRANLEQELEHKTRLIDDLYKKIDNLSSGDQISLDSGHPRSMSISVEPNFKILEGVVDIHIKGRSRGEKVQWVPKYALLKPFSLYLYHTRDDRDSNSPWMLEIPVSRIFHVREISQVDLMHAKEEDLPRVLQIIYTDASSHHCDSQGCPNDQAGRYDWYGHTFQGIRFHRSTLCAACNRVCSDMLNPPPAVECTQCHYKMHLSHIDEHMKIQSCAGNVKTQLLRVGSKQEKNHWKKRIFDLKTLHKESGGEVYDSNSKTSLLHFSQQKLQHRPSSISN